MIDPIEERLQDLERLVLKQSERIDELEEALAVMQRTTRRGLLVPPTRESEEA